MRPILAQNSKIRDIVTKFQTDLFSELELKKKVQLPIEQDIKLKFNLVRDLPFNGLCSKGGELEFSVLICPYGKDEVYPENMPYEKETPVFTQNMRFSKKIQLKHPGSRVQPRTFGSSD